jgi:hypothetical protein
MPSLDSLIEPYKEWVLNDAGLIDDVSNAIHESDNTHSIEEIKHKLEELVKNHVNVKTSEDGNEAVKEEVVVVKKSKNQKINSKRFVGVDRSTRERTMTLLKVVQQAISKYPYGINKTQLLKVIRKDNSHWRTEIDMFIGYLLEDGLIQTDGKSYYPPNVIVKSRERRMHRTIFELLSEKSLTLTEIYKKTGCNGGKSRGYVKLALQDLKNEGYIVQENKRWKWA